jgi:hypothetical protein
MNLPFAFLWLALAVGVFGYELFTGTTPFTIRGLNVSAGWLFLLLAAWNFVRWYSYRTRKAELEALRVAHEARLRQARHREPPDEPDPTFDFSDKPPP